MGPRAKMFGKQWARWFGVAFSEGVRKFDLSQNVQFNTGAHKTSYSVGTEDRFLGGEAAEA